MALREVVGMEHHRCNHPGRLLCHYRSPWT